MHIIMRVRQQQPPNKPLFETSRPPTPRPPEAQNRSCLSPASALGPPAAAPLSPLGLSYGYTTQKHCTYTSSSSSSRLWLKWSGGVGLPKTWAAHMQRRKTLVAGWSRAACGMQGQVGLLTPCGCACASLSYRVRRGLRDEKGFGSCSAAVLLGCGGAGIAVKGFVLVFFAFRMPFFGRGEGIGVV